MLDAPASGAEFLAWMVGGVALLVWGMRMVRTGVQRAYGERLRAFVGGWLATRGHGWAAGLLVTLLLQSSTATCLLISAFAGRALVPLGIALAVMLGADVGTTLVAMIFTLDVGALAPLLCAVGTIAFLVGRDRKRRSRARAVLGLGLILLSLQIIVGSSAVLRESETAAIVLGSLTDEPVVALLLSAGLTWVMHSSLAMVLFVASLAAAGVLSTPLLLMLVLGANVGGALVPYTATLAEPLAARRVAGGNALFKLIGAALILPVLEPLAQGLAAFELSGTQLAVAAHFGFNAAVSLLFLPALGAMPALLARLVRPRPDETGAYGAQGTAMEHLADSDLDTPKSALANAERVAVNAAIVAEGMLSAVESGLRENDEDALGGLGQQDDLIDDMHERVKRYLTRLRRVPLDEAESRRANEILTYMANIEHAGDIIEKTLKDVARKKARRGLAFSEEGQSEIDSLFERVRGTLRLSMNVLSSGDLDLARTLLAEKEAFGRSERDASDRHYERLESEQEATVQTSALHMDVLQDLRRLNSHFAAAAYPLLAEAGDLRSSRLKKSAREAVAQQTGARRNG